MNLSEAETKAVELMKKHLGSDTEWVFEWSSSKRSFGDCNYFYKRIRLSKPLTFGESDDNRVIDTILHEIAHAIAGPYAKHGSEWKAVARKIGATPKASGSMGVGSKAPDPKYVIVCPKGKIVKRYYNKPNYKTLMKMKNMYVPGRKEETLGNLKIIPYSHYKVSYAS